MGKLNHTSDKNPLFQIGKAKTGQYETQYKMMLTGLDPLGLTLALDFVSEERANDPLYLPFDQFVKQVLSEKGVVEVGDSKISAFSVRATIWTKKTWPKCKPNWLAFIPSIQSAAPLTQPQNACCGFRQHQPHDRACCWSTLPAHSAHRRAAVYPGTLRAV